MKDTFPMFKTSFSFCFTLLFSNSVTQMAQQSWSLSGDQHSEDLWSSSLPFLLDLTWRWADRTVGLKPCRISHVISVKNMSFARRSSSHRTHQRNSVLRPGSTASPFTPRWVTFQNIHRLPTWIITFFQAKPGLTASPGPFPRPLPKSVQEHGSENKREASWVCSLLH